MALAGIALVLAAMIIGFSAANEDSQNFSQDPGFAAYYAENPPSSVLPSAAEQVLLRRFRPDVFLPPGHPGLIGFYDDYISQGVLYDGNGRLITDKVTQAVLNAHKTEPGAEFVHKPADGVTSPTVQARIDRDELAFPLPNGGVDRRAFTFLTYNLVFRSSGLPAGLPRWMLRLAGVFASTTDWHQLDQYTAVTMVLDQGQTPVAVMLQQHHFVRAYIVGQEIELMPDGRPAVDAAIGSNELYPHKTGRTLRRATGTMSAESLTYLVTGEGQSLFGFEDVTDGAGEADYRLDFLPPDDAFYRFEGWLGARRLLPGRDGPPGADYNTWPAFKPPGMQLLTSYWRQGDASYVRLIDDGLGEGRIDAAMTLVLARRFWLAWQCEGPSRSAACDGE